MTTRENLSRLRDRLRALVARLEAVPTGDGRQARLIAEVRAAIADIRDARSSAQQPTANMQSGS